MAKDTTSQIEANMPATPPDAKGPSAVQAESSATAAEVMAEEAKAALRRLYGGKLPKTEHHEDAIFIVQIPGHAPNFVSAPNQDEAWARYCQAVKSFPSPKKLRVLVEVTPKKAG